MSYNFENAIKFFKEDKIRELSLDSEGLRFLKLRSISRSDIMLQFANSLNLKADEIPKKKLLEFLFKSKISANEIDEFIKKFHSKNRIERIENENKLINELYNLKIFDWGGLYQNSLEKTIIDNYVKKIESYNELANNIDEKLYPSMKSYVLCSWYNHWTSIIIEDIFKDHKNVLPAIGLIKKIDFFVKNIPFDLKVTYLPEGYIKFIRKKKLFKPELTLLKKFARDNEIAFVKEEGEAKILEKLWRKIKDIPTPEAKKLLNDIFVEREKIVSECIKDPKELITWLYENQGVRRFDSSNRLFLILIDKNDYFASWELKRAKPLLEKTINNFLDKKEKIGKEIKFNWEGDQYKSLADAVFVVR